MEIEEAIDLLTSRICQIREIEKEVLENLPGRILAEDVEAVRDQPPFPRSPLDGYAVRAADLGGISREHPAVLSVIGKIYAGKVFEGEIGPGQAVRLMTGAPIPAGADTVIRQEDTIERGGKVQIFVSSKPYQNYCFQGEDYKAGTVLLKAGCRLDAGKIAVLSSMGRAEAAVYRQPTIAVISTGDEVLVPGEPWKPGKIYDSNRAYICARLAQAGNPPVISKHLSDDAALVAEEIKKAAHQSDLVITVGGVSVGEKDIMHEVGEILGGERIFWKIRIKPGSPVLAFIYEGLPVLCLSGNPFGAIANFELLARPVLAALTGQKDWLLKTETAILQEGYKKPKGSRRFLRGYYADGNVSVSSGMQASGGIASMAGCNCLVEISEDMPGAEKGASVRIYHL